MVQRSGLLGVAGTSDMKALLDARDRGDARARLAIDMFTHRARKYLGAYLAVLGGADAVIFGGGIGERAPQLREEICRDMHWCGIELDTTRNAALGDDDRRISTDSSAIELWVIAVDEASIIARDCATVIALITMQPGQTRA
jgi:acetate kinase